MVEEFDAEGANVADRPDLVDHAGGNLSAPLIADNNFGANWQVPIDLDRGSVPIEADRFGLDRERAVLNVFSRQSDGRAERHPGAAAFGCRVERDVQGSDTMLGLMKTVFHGVEKISHRPNRGNLRWSPRGW